MRPGQDARSDFASALATEWLLANGLGGSASGTAAGAHTRRTHALLLAAGPHGRLTTLLLGFDERLHEGGAGIDLACHLVAGGARPAAHALIESFACDPWPTWVYRAGGVAIEKSLFVISGHNAVAVRYRLLDGPASRLTVSPLVVARDPHAIQREDASLHATAHGVPGRVRIELAPDRPALTLWHNGTFLPARVWVRGIEYPADAGHEPEDALIPGYIEATLERGAALHVVAAAETDLFRALARSDRLGEIPPRSLAACVELLERDEREQLATRVRQALAGAGLTAREAADAHAPDDASGAPAPAGDDPWSAPLAGVVLRALARRAHRLTLGSALPAGAERGADTLRMLPALVSLRAFTLVREALRDAIAYLDEGLAPESFDPADGSPRYGDPAASLWLVHAAELYVRRSEDLDLARETLYPALEGVMQFYRAGTRHGIRVDADGLLAAGERGVKRADVNALWYHALVAMAQLARLTGRKENAAFYLAWAREHQARFNAALWDDPHGALFEAIEDGEPRPGLSPSQLLAVRMSPALLTPERALRLVKTIERKLWTPVGLREAPRARRAETAWIGAFCSATLRANQRAPEAQARVRGWLDALRPALERGVRGAPPEWFELPARAAAIDPAACGRGGEPVSALAAAELLQVWIEEVEHAAHEAPAPA